MTEQNIFGASKFTINDKIGKRDILNHTGTIHANSNVQSQVLVSNVLQSNNNTPNQLQIPSIVYDHPRLDPNLTQENNRNSKIQSNPPQFQPQLSYDQHSYNYHMNKNTNQSVVRKEGIYINKSPPNSDRQQNNFFQQHQQEHTLHPQLPILPNIFPDNSMTSNSLPMAPSASAQYSNKNVNYSQFQPASSNIVGQPQPQVMFSNQNNTQMPSAYNFQNNQFVPFSSIKDMHIRNRINNGDGDKQSQRNFGDVYGHNNTPWPMESFNSTAHRGRVALSDDEDKSKPQYCLRVMQEPIHCKVSSCFDKGGLSDRRSIDPPPILRLSVMRNRIPVTDSDFSVELQDDEISKEYTPPWLFEKTFLLMCEILKEPDDQAEKKKRTSGDKKQTEIKREKEQKEIEKGKGKGKEKKNTSITDKDNIDVNEEADISEIDKNEDSGDNEDDSQSLNNIDKRFNSSYPLLGVRVSSGHKVQYKEQTGFYFVFGDLSMMSIGEYRLKFSLYEQEDIGFTFKVSNISSYFTVFTPKRYTGSLPSTNLTKLVCEQGVRLRLRKDTSKNSKQARNRSLRKPPGYLPTQETRLYRPDTTMIPIQNMTYIPQPQLYHPMYLGISQQFHQNNLKRSNDGFAESENLDRLKSRSVSLIYPQHQPLIQQHQQRQSVPNPTYESGVIQQQNNSLFTQQFQSLQIPQQPMQVQSIVPSGEMVRHFKQQQEQQTSSYGINNHIIMRGSNDEYLLGQKLQEQNFQNTQGSLPFSSNVNNINGIINSPSIITPRPSISTPPDLSTGRSSSSSSTSNNSKPNHRIKLPPLRSLGI